MSPLPPLLHRPPPPAVPGRLQEMRRADRRRIAGTWLPRRRASEPAPDAIARELEAALGDGEAAGRILAGLRDRERDVLAVYVRHGGTLNGRVAFLELLTRGLIEVRTRTWEPGYSTEEVDRRA